MNEVFLKSLRDVVGDAYVLTAQDDMVPYFRDYRGRFVGSGVAVVRPADTAQVSAVVKICATHGVPIIPQGGNTGLVGGSIPYDGKGVVLSLSRMNAIRTIDADNFTMTVEAGCVLSTVQQAADNVQRYFPLSLASEGSCQIGGVIAANAGGILTIRYGNMRDLVLGLEVVLPNGEIWNGLRSLRKDNTGYDLKHLFIGSEGTLGIVTAAVLKLYAPPGLRETFFASTDDIRNVTPFLSLMRDAFGESILAFELIARRGVEFAVKYNPQCAEPLQNRAPWNFLVEISGGKNGDGLRGRVEEALARAFELGLIGDAVIAQNEQQRQMFWVMRESVSDAQRYAGASIKHDISVPVYKIPEFVIEATALVEKMIPDVRPVIFGHAGDGNLHFNLTEPEGADRETFLARWDEVNHAVHDIVQKYDGSIAAEHGVGTFKAAEMAQRKSSVEMDLMRLVKNTLDEDGLMNPGKVLA